MNACGDIAHYDKTGYRCYYNDSIVELEDRFLKDSYISTRFSDVDKIFKELKIGSYFKERELINIPVNAAAQMERETVLPPGSPINPSAEPLLAVSAELVDKLSSMPMPPAALQLAAMLDPITLPPNGPTVYVGVRKRIVDLLAQALSSAGQASGADFSYSQDRVNPYKEEHGFCPVSTLSITRSGLRKDGSVSQMPWYITIKNFRAKPVKQKNGMTSYNGSTIQDQKEAFILVSDFDMYRCAYRVVRFIELWEMSVGIPLIKAGLKQKEIERASR